MGSRQPAVSAGPGEGDCLAVLPPTRSPARASALARTTSGSRGSGGRTSCQGRSRRTLCRWIRIRCIVSHLPGQPPIPGGRWRQPGPVGPALGETVRIAARVGRHPKVPAGWNIAARRSVTRRCYRADLEAMSGDQAQVACAGYGLDAVGRAASSSRHSRAGRCCRSCALVGPANDCAACRLSARESLREKPGLTSGTHRHAVGKGRGARRSHRLDAGLSGRWC